MSNKRRWPWIRERPEEEAARAEAKARAEAQARAEAKARAEARDQASGGTTGGSLLTAISNASAADIGLSNETIYAAVSRIAGALATMPIELYRGYTRATDDELYWLMALRPNRRMSAYAFKRAMETWRNTEGVAYAVKRMDMTGKLRELEVIPPNAVTPVRERESGDIWYRITRADGEVEYLHNWYVLALHHMTKDGVTAPRVLDVLRGSIKYSEDVRTFSLDLLKSVNKGIVLEFPTVLAGERREKAVREFIDLYRRTGGQVIALEAGIKYGKLDSSPIESGLESVESITRSRAAMVYNLPAHLLGVTSDATASSIEQQNIEFLTLTMQPIVAMWEQELDYKLLTPEQRRAGYHYRIDQDAYLRGDSAALAARDQAAIRTGKNTVNELRARYMLPPVEGGDRALVSKDLAPIDLVARGATISLDELAGEHNSAGGTNDTEDNV